MTLSKTNTNIVEPHYANIQENSRRVLTTLHRMKIADKPHVAEIWQADPLPTVHRRQYSHQDCL